MGSLRGSLITAWSVNQTRLPHPGSWFGLDRALFVSFLASRTVEELSCQTVLPPIHSRSLARVLRIFLKGREGRYPTYNLFLNRMNAVSTVGPEQWVSAYNITQ